LEEVLGWKKFFVGEIEIGIAIGIEIEIGIGIEIAIGIENAIGKTWVSDTKNWMFIGFRSDTPRGFTQRRLG